MDRPFSDEPLGPPCQPDCDLCSECHEHSSFHRDEEGECISDCCFAPPVPVDHPAWERD